MITNQVWSRLRPGRGGPLNLTDFLFFIFPDRKHWLATQQQLGLSWEQRTKGSSLVLGSWVVQILVMKIKIFQLWAIQCSLPGSLSSHSGKFLQTVAPATPSCSPECGHCTLAVHWLYTGLYTAAKVAPEETERSFLPFTHPPPTPGQAGLHNPHQYHSLPHIPHCTHYPP